MPSTRRTCLHHSIRKRQIAQKRGNNNSRRFRSLVVSPSQCLSCFLDLFQCFYLLATIHRILAVFSNFGLINANFVLAKASFYSYKTISIMVQFSATLALQGKDSMETSITQSLPLRIFALQVTEPWLVHN